MVKTTKQLLLTPQEDLSPLGTTTLTWTNWLKLWICEQNWLANNSTIDSNQSSRFSPISTNNLLLSSTMRMLSSSLCNNSRLFRLLTRKRYKFCKGKSSVFWERKMTMPNFMPPKFDNSSVNSQTRTWRRANFLNKSTNLWLQSAILKSSSRIKWESLWTPMVTWPDNLIRR